MRRWRGSPPPAATTCGCSPTTKGVAFEDDGLRDGEELRPWMTDRFDAELRRTGRRTVRLTGPHPRRLATAVAAVDALLDEGWNFADPLPDRTGMTTASPLTERG